MVADTIKPKAIPAAEASEVLGGITSNPAQLRQEMQQRSWSRSMGWSSEPGIAAAAGLDMAEMGLKQTASLRARCFANVAHVA